MPTPKGQGLSGRVSKVEEELQTVRDRLTGIEEETKKVLSELRSGRKESKGNPAVDVSEQIEKLFSAQREVISSVEELTGRVQSLEFTAPPKRLNAMEVKQMVEKDPTTKFVVLEDWRYLGETFREGRVLSAHQYPAGAIVSYANAGLALGYATKQAEEDEEARAAFG